MSIAATYPSPLGPTCVALFFPRLAPVSQYSPDPWPSCTAQLATSPGPLFRLATCTVNVDGLQIWVRLDSGHARELTLLGYTTILDSHGSPTASLDAKQPRIFQRRLLGYVAVLFPGSAPSRCTSCSSSLHQVLLALSPWYFALACDNRLPSQGNQG